MRHQTDPPVRIGPPTPCPHCQNDNPRLQERASISLYEDRVLCLVCAKGWREAP